MKRFILAVVFVALLAVPAWALNTVTRTGNNISIVFDGSNPVDFATDTTIKLPNGAYYDRIELKAAAANDTVQLRETTSSGAIVLYFKSIDGGPQVSYLNKEFHRFYIVGSEATASATLILHIAQ